LKALKIEYCYWKWLKNCLTIRQSGKTTN